MRLAALPLPQVRRFINVSTDEVYGESSLGKEEGLNEGSPLEPTNPYSAAKVGRCWLLKRTLSGRSSAGWEHMSIQCWQFRRQAAWVGCDRCCHPCCILWSCAALVPPPAPEHPPTSPLSQAGAEMMARAYHTSYKLPVIVTRGNNVYGPHQFPEKMM